MARYRRPDTPLAATEQLFFVTTTYHLLLATIMAGNPALCPGPSTLILKAHLRDGVDTLLDAVRADPCSVFAQCVMLSRPPRYKRGQRALADRRRRSELVRMAAECAPARAFVFNEGPLDQTLARVVHEKGGQVFGVEDGAIAYSAVRRRLSASELFKLRLWFGPHVRSPAVEGASTHDLDAFYAIYPDQVRPEIPRSATRAIDVAAAHEAGLPGWMQVYLSRLSIAPESLACDGIVALSRSNNFRHLPDYAKRMQAVLARLSQPNERWAISYHPNEKHPDPLAAGALGFEILDKDLPIELIYLAAGSRLRYVIGDIGTALMSARWLAPAAGTLSLMRYLRFADPPFDAALAAIGVDHIETINQLENWRNTP